MANLLLAVIYLSFISLGLPDALLGAAWPTMYPEMGARIGWAGVISAIICLGTIVSSVNSDRLTRRLGAGNVTALSVGLTAAALFGFSLCRSFPMLCLMAVPYGLGAGAVDAAINNYVALHYPSRHMSWLHCMWGIGAAAGPYIMGAALTRFTWPVGYRIVGVLQVLLTAVLFFSLPLWKKGDGDGDKPSGRGMRLSEVVAIPGVKAVAVTFFCYCALESTSGLWAASYLVVAKGLDEATAASWAGLFYLGITGGRFLNGFLTARFEDRQLIRFGGILAALGAASLLLPLGRYPAAAGLVALGLGCAPVYPCMIHSTPVLFGAERSQSIIGVQMAAAYCGSALIPPTFGLLAGRVSVSLYPPFLLIIAVLMLLTHAQLTRITGK